MPWWRPDPLWPTPPKPSEGSAPWTAAELTQAPPEVVQNVVGDGLVLREHVQGERPLAGVDVVGRLVDVVVGLDRQDRAEDLLLHQGLSVYLSDPDGNGIELYYDRPRADWYDADGRPVLKTERFDYRELLPS